MFTHQLCQKMSSATFWVIFFTNSSGHPVLKKHLKNLVVEKKELFVELEKQIVGNAVLRGMGKLRNNRLGGAEEDPPHARGSFFVVKKSLFFSCGEGFLHKYLKQRVCRILDNLFFWVYLNFTYIHKLRQQLPFQNIS
jgi:hypothetical protein